MAIFNRNTHILLERAYLSILAASTIQTYERTWDASFTDIGFVNRIFIVPGSAEKKFSLPEKIPDTHKSALKQGLRQVLSHIGYGLELELTPDARALFDDWYLKLERSIHAKRLDTYATRFMSLLAANELKFEVDTGIVRKVIALMEWELEARRLYDPLDAENEVAKLEQKIVRVLRTGPKKDRQLKQAIHANRAGLWYYQMATTNLEKAGEIAFDKTQQLWGAVST